MYNFLFQPNTGISFTPMSPRIGSPARQEGDGGNKTGGGGRGRGRGQRDMGIIGK